MFTVPDWRFVMSSTGSNGCILDYEDHDRGLQMSVWSPKRGEQRAVYVFRGDPLKRAFADEDSMIRAYELEPGAVCCVCGAVGVAE